MAASAALRFSLASRWAAAFIKKGRPAARAAKGATAKGIRPRPTPTTALGSEVAGAWAGAGALEGAGA